MDIEPLPKVTFLPAELTALVIKNWTGEVIDYEKNGQVSFNTFNFNLDNISKFYDIFDSNF